MGQCKWLPDLYDYPDWNNFKDYEDKLYEVFRLLYLDSELSFLNKPLRYRYQPKFNEKEEVFYHCTCKDYSSINSRQPDPNRMIRIRWIKAFIENYICRYNCFPDCPLYWTETYKNKNLRHYIYLEGYLVIIEERESYFLFITAFFVEDEYYHKGLLKRAKKQKTLHK